VVLRDTADADLDAGVLGSDGLPVARRIAAGVRRDHRDVRATLAGHDRGSRVLEPSARQLPRRLWWRPRVRYHGVLWARLARRSRCGPHRRSHPGRVRAAEADASTAGAGRAIGHDRKQETEPIGSVFRSRVGDEETYLIF